MESLMNSDVSINYGDIVYKRTSSNRVEIQTKVTSPSPSPQSFTYNDYLMNNIGQEKKDSRISLNESHETYANTSNIDKAAEHFCERCIHHDTMHHQNQYIRTHRHISPSNTDDSGRVTSKLFKSVKINESTVYRSPNDNEIIEPKSLLNRSPTQGSNQNLDLSTSTGGVSQRFPQKFFSRIRSISASHPVEFSSNVTRSHSLIEESDEDENNSHHHESTLANSKVPASTTTTNNNNNNNSSHVKPKFSYTFGIPAHTLFKRKPRVNNVYNRNDESFSSTIDCNQQPKYSSSAQNSDGMFEQLQGAVDIITTRRRCISHVFERPPNLFNINKAVDCNTHIVISKSIDNETISEPFNRRNFQSFDREDIIIALFQHSTAYDVMPDSAKFVILDSNLSISRSIQCLLENGIQAAPIWNSSSYSFIGNFNQLTAVQLLATIINDSSNVSKSFFSPSTFVEWKDKVLYEVLNIFEEISIKTYNYCPINLFSKNLFVSPMLSLVDVIKHFLIPYEVVKRVTDTREDYEENTYKVPPPCQVVIVDPNLGNSIGLITIDRLISYVRLVLGKLPHSDILKLIISRIDSYTHRILSSDHNFSTNWSVLANENDICSILLQLNETTCLGALHLFDRVQRKFALAQLPAIPWLPVMHDCKFVGILSPGDILHYFLEGTDIEPATDKVSKILSSKFPTCSQQRENFCDSNDNILQVIDKMFRLKTTMLLIYDRNEERFTGLITAVDLLSFLLDLPIGSLEDQPKMSHSCNCCCCKCQICLSDSTRDMSTRQRVSSAHEDSLFKMDNLDETVSCESNNSLIEYGHTAQNTLSIVSHFKTFYDYISESEKNLFSKLMGDYVHDY